MNFRFLSAASLITSSASSKVVDIGFSTKTCFPAFSAALIIG